MRGNVAEQRRVREIAGRDLERRQAELGKEVRARLVEDRTEEGHALLARELAELEPLRGRELERLTVLAVRAPERVLVVVRRVEEVTRVEAAVVALLELDGIRAALLRRTNERLRLLDITLVVVPDLRDDVRRAVPRDDLAIDDQLAHGAMVLAKPERQCSTAAFTAPAPA